MTSEFKEYFINGYNKLYNMETKRFTGSMYKSGCPIIRFYDSFATEEIIFPHISVKYILPLNSQTEISVVRPANIVISIEGEGRDDYKDYWQVLKKWETEDIPNEKVEIPTTLRLGEWGFEPYGNDSTTTFMVPMFVSGKITYNLKKLV